MKRILVFCGSSPGRGGKYKAAAEALGRLLAKRGLGLVYGGGNVGLMGVVADAVLEGGGEVIGVITKQLVGLEVAHKGLHELKVVGSMHQRKAEMERLADAIVALPGGFGTMDEFCEIVTWAQLGIHEKPVGLLNVDGYYDAFLKFVSHAEREGFIREAHKSLFYQSEDPRELLDLFAKHKPSAAVRRWLAKPKP